MKVIAFVDRKKVIAEVSPDDLAGISGISAYEFKEKFKRENCMSCNDFLPGIVGQEINPSAIFEEATKVIALHKDALSAADTLRKAASRFCGFFAEIKNN